MKNDKDNLIAIFKRNIAMHANGPVLSSDQFSSEVKTEMNGFIRGLQRGLEIVELTEPATTQIAALEQDVHDLAVTQIDYQKLTHEQREQIAALRSALESIRDLPNGKSHTRAIGIAIKALARQGIDRI